MSVNFAEEAKALGADIKAVRAKWAPLCMAPVGTAEDIKQVWDYRAAGLTVDKARKYIKKWCKSSVGLHIPPDIVSSNVGINSDLGYKASFVYNGSGWDLYNAYIEWCHSGNRSYYTQDGSGKFPKRYLWGYNFLGVMCHAYPNCLAPIFNSMI